jgi:hypothetical protein
MEISMEFPQKKKQLKIEIPHDSAMPLLGIHLQECKSACNRDTRTLMFIAALFIIAKLWNQPKCQSIDEKIKWCTYTQ